ncbi:MAG: response regulator transcription factor [Flavobacterium sp.]|uniref:LytR/AlgR family response regulator transcription factor n=1 Tax=Flavobacterium sp. TaxID=239 RepID=UPI00121F27D3|nr:LytTR family DNA-binding domain-containing protein [Flavobacterium sp.]RZJ67644.1 MAG: response regulator transcription factor [Flavobacterium sp.]
MSIKTVIIDDEPLAIEVIKSYCESLQEIELLATFSSPVEAMTYINSNAVDLVFLDIEMPLLNGMELVETLQYRPQIVFTTAYPQFALEGFELDACDYLIKPVPYKRFLKAVNKVRKLVSTEATSDVIKNTESTEKQYIFIKSEYESLKIFADDIKYVESLRDYLKIHLTSGKHILTLSNFKNLMDKLPENTFFRVHNSYVVNISYINSIQRNRVLIDNNRIPVSDTYKKAFFEKIKM